MGPRAGFGLQPRTFRSSAIELSHVPTIPINAVNVQVTNSISVFRVPLQTNRTEMTKEAKKASKIEKKLRILLGGYQVGN